MNAFSAEIHLADWVVAPKAFPAPVISRLFHADGLQKADIALSALGSFVLYVNGKRVGNDYFLPANSLYRARSKTAFLYPTRDDFTYRCYYTVYDLTPYVKDGENRLEIALGNGWYRQTERTAEGNVAFGDRLGAIYALTLEDKAGRRTLLSDGTEDCRTCNTLASDLFYGETYDARCTEFTHAPVDILKLPDTLLTPDDAPPDRVFRTLESKQLFADGSRQLYDAGENISGFVCIETDAPAGEPVRIRYAETIRGNELFFGGTGDDFRSPSGVQQIMQDTFIGDGHRHVFEPQFLWHAFRYFEICGNGRPLCVKVIHSDVPITSAFHSSSPELNWLYTAFLRTQTANMHQGVPLDCPHRERLGYTGDGQVCAPAAMQMLGAQAFYRKWIRDIFDSQDSKTGHVNHTAPFAGGGGGPGGWGMAAITVPYHYYVLYGDITPAKEHYEGIKKWINYLIAHSENGLVVREEEGGWCLGDWNAPEPMALDPAFVNTCLFIRALRFAGVIARGLGQPEDADRFNRLIDTAGAAVVRDYYNATTHSFADGLQGADAFAVAAGLGDAATMENLKQKYAALGHFDTGFLATDLLIQVLLENGGEDIAFALLTSHTPGSSFGDWMDKGATTIWETWRGDNSLNHPMFGACSRMLFSGILGIRPAADPTGSAPLLIAPKTPEGLRFAEGYTTLPGGRLSVSWRREAAQIRFTVTVPEKQTAVFRYGETAMPLHSGTNHFLCAQETGA